MWLSMRIEHLSRFNSFLASGDFCRLLTTFANSLDPDQNDVGFDLDPKRLTRLFNHLNHNPFAKNTCLFNHVDRIGLPFY